MCYALLVVPIFCTLQTILRVVMTIVLAVEDILRMAILAVHNWVSTSIQALAMIPFCLVYCCSKQCFRSTSCCSPGCYSMRSSCGCILFLTMIGVFLLVYFFTNWWEDIFATFELHSPYIFEKKTDNTKLQEANKNKSQLMSVKSAHKTVQSSQIPVHGAHENISHSTESIKHVRIPPRDIRHEMKNDLDFSYIDHFKEKVHKFRSDETNFTYVTVIVKAFLKEPDDITLRK